MRRRWRRRGRRRGDGRRTARDHHSLGQRRRRHDPRLASDDEPFVVTRPRCVVDHSITARFSATEAEAGTDHDGGADAEHRLAAAPDRAAARR
ncbi:MAG: hypothetical protein M3501_05940 [Actinomycetota bacterium]|nr:hypothetical protein [Actinomycetota bacterium]